MFLLCSPSICHSDSDLSEGSRKYSPSSETSVETQRACGKTDIIIKHGNLHTCIHMQSHTQRVTHANSLAELTGSRLTPFINGLPDVLFKVLCHTNKRLIIWKNGLVCIFPLFSPVIAEGSSCSHHLRLKKNFFFFSPGCLSGGFSETYAALCDYNGISCKEEVQWVRAVGLCLCCRECFQVLCTAVCTKWGRHILQQTGSWVMLLLGCGHHLSLPGQPRV